MIAWYERYLDRHVFGPSNWLHRFMWRRLWRFYWHVATPLRRNGAAKVLDFRLFTVFVVEKKSKAVAHMYLGKSWLMNGRSFGKTIKVVFAVPVFDSMAELSKKYG